MVLHTIEQLPVTRKRVLVRASLNVPLGSGGDVLDDYRLQQAVPTIRHAAERKAKVIVAGHLGRPQAGFDRSLSLAPVAKRLTQLLDHPVAMAEDSVGHAVEEAVALMKPGDILLLENLRFHQEEESNDPDFSGQLASLADVYINDAFSASHRGHASIVGVPPRSPVNGIGFLMQKEIEALSRLRENAESPFVVILGGSKVKTKLKAIRHFVQTSDVVLLGGFMGLTMLRAAGVSVGASAVEQDLLEEARLILAESRHARASMMTAKDHVIAEKLEAEATFRTTDGPSIPDGSVGCDIGPKTIEDFRKAVLEAKTLFWNGPMGAFEIPPCDRGTNEIAEAVTADVSANIAGGGDTVSYLLGSGYAKAFTHLSTGGGAALKFVMDGDLPGLEAIRRGV